MSKFNWKDFLPKRARKEDLRFNYRRVVYTDNGNEVYTDGYYCLIHKTGSDFEGQAYRGVIGKDEVKLEDLYYPPYRKVVLPESELVEMQDITRDMLKSILEHYPRANYVKERDKVLFAEADVVFPIWHVRMLFNFWETYPTAKLFARERLDSELCMGVDKNRQWTLMADNGDLLVVMPGARNGVEAGVFERGEFKVA